MGRYTGQPFVPIRYLRPTRASFDVVGSAMEGGRNGLGQSISIEMSGGGMVTATYERCVLQGDDMERHEVINWIGAWGNGSFRFFVVPIINDGIGPFPIINGKRRPIIGGIPHSDGSLFSDGAGHSQATVWGEITEVVHSGIIKMRAFNLARELRWSDWVSIYHPTKGHRAYRYWDVIARFPTKTDEYYSYTDEHGTTHSCKDYTLAMSPPLREAVTVGTRVELAEPKCVMRFPAGFTVPWDYEAWYQSRPSLQFVEAF